MMKKIFICVLLSLSLCACQSTSVSSGDNNQVVTEVSSGDNSQVVIEDITPTVFPSEYTKSGEHTSINVVSIEPTEAYFIEGTARSMEFDYEEIGRSLIPAEEIGEENIEYGQLLSENMVGNFYEKLFYWGENTNTATYDTAEADYIYSCIREESKADDYSLPLYTEEQEFSFGTAEEALEIIKAHLKEIWGIEVDSSYEIHTYYLDYETVQQHESHLDIYGNRVEGAYKAEWSEADNAYLFYFHQTYCGLPDYHTTDSFGYAPYADESGAQIKVMYGEEGILYIAVKDINIYEMGSEQLDLMPFEELADRVIEHYDGFLDDLSYEITSAQLTSVYKNSSGDSKEIIPVWAFRITETDSEGASTEYQIQVDAQTGDVL